VVNPFARIVQAMTKYRTKVFDLGFILVLLGAATLFMFEVDVFQNEGGISQKQQTIELDELLFLTTLIMLATLAYTWRRAREHRRENARRIEAEKEIFVLAMQDPLTGLPNRRQFNEALKAALHKVPAAPEAHAVLLLDLNGFKKINDFHGHPVGDEVLIHVGSRLLTAVRDGDMVARLGGDEFAVLARNVSGPEAVTNLARRIIESLTAPIAAGRTGHVVGTAIGIALSPQDGATAEEILRKADVALYRAKPERVSSLRFFEPEMDNQLRERELLEAALHRAVADDAIALRFKPVVNGRTGKVTAFEALPQWVHPDFGEVAADRFMPIAEDTGLGPTLTEQLLRKACAAALNWPSDIRLALNLTAAQLKTPSFGMRLLAILGELKLAPARIDLEIDEGTLIREGDVTKAVLDPLRAIGISVVATHFGTGYSDLQNLHRLRLDRIKIDPAFIGAMLHDREAATMVKALVGIGSGMDIPVSADGVTDETQLAALVELGCNELQGLRYGAPLDAAATVALVRDRSESGTRDIALRA
jgi:diguanylate cyclase (GGDEF)-like protein